MVCGGAGGQPPGCGGRHQPQADCLHLCLQGQHGTGRQDLGQVQAAPFCMVLQHQQGSGEHPSRQPTSVPGRTAQSRWEGLRLSPGSANLAIRRSTSRAVGDPQADSPHLCEAAVAAHRARGQQHSHLLSSRRTSLTHCSAVICCLADTPAWHTAGAHPCSPRLSSTSCLHAICTCSIGGTAVAASCFSPRVSTPAIRDLSYKVVWLSVLRRMVSLGLASASPQHGPCHHRGSSCCS